MVDEKLAFNWGGPGSPERSSEWRHLESAIEQIRSKGMKIPSEVDCLTVNPTLQLFQPSWKVPASDGQGQPGGFSAGPSRSECEEWALVWRDPRMGEVRAASASEEELLVLKMVIEGVGLEQVAEKGGWPVAAVDRALDRAAQRGILLVPSSHIRRDSAAFPVGVSAYSPFLSAPRFTLQWQITQAFDLHCEHCYDRSDRPAPSLEQATAILDDLRSFCCSRHVKGEVSFSGGNPLLYASFKEAYRAASDRGFAISILGNPVPKEQLEELLAIQRPAFFQVSLEGLAEYNDRIRGPGDFKRTIEFLGDLHDLGIPSTVMLPLTSENIDQVLPLAEGLRWLSDSFVFDRLSPVREGAGLPLPGREEFAAFLGACMEAAAHNPIMGLKDNLFNILRHQKGMGPVGGCTGYGCGAAFNFVALLADGEVHACRKFPSPIGNAFEQGLSEVYESEMGRRYRAGCSACRSCPIRSVCGSCLAVAHRAGLDAFEERDPHCFMPVTGQSSKPAGDGNAGESRAGGG